MSTGNSAALKAVRSAISKAKWDDVIQQTQEIILRDERSYQAHVCLAFALDKENQFAEALSSYKTAASLKPSDPQAFQGLIKIFEKLDPTKVQVAQFKDAVLNLANIFYTQDELYKSQDVVDKFIDWARTQASQLQYVEALAAILPDSSIYPALEGRLPPPAQTYQTIARILEAHEKARINTLIGERRTRIGARLAEVKTGVKREILGASQLGHIYEQLINWTNDDAIRRQYEEKLFQFHHDRLLVLLPGPEKTDGLARVRKLASDMVIIRHPFQLAWEINISWQDFKEIKEWDATILHDYCSHFPGTDLSKVIAAFKSSSISPFPLKQMVDSEPAHSQQDVVDSTSEDDEDGGAPTHAEPFNEEDRLVMMVEGISTSKSLFAHRLMGEYYQHLEEHESNVELMRKAIELVDTEAKTLGIPFSNTRQSFMLYLGTALVFYQSPRNHSEAKDLFDQVLESDPASTAALIGHGLISEEEEDYDPAIEFLERALTRDDSDLRVKAELAWLYALSGDYDRGKTELENLVHSISAKGSASKELLSQTQHRLGVCIWNLDSSRAARKSRDGAYAYFLAALKTNFSYAPAYTSLGIYYADYAKDKKRARKCFLKAVELSSAEVESAERLARSFADDGDWDRVELVAQRVVDSGKVRPPPGSKKKGIGWPFSALGVAELNKLNFNKAIVSFNAALRMSPNDYHSWVGLGESYHNAGRHVAATKAIVNARMLEEKSGLDLRGDSWFTKYTLANIRRDTGDFDEAISLYEDVFSERPNEAGVVIALLQTLVSYALDSVERGFFGRSTDLASRTIAVALTATPEVYSTFNFWKVIGDACSVFSLVPGRVDQFPRFDFCKLLEIEQDAAYQALQDVDRVDRSVASASTLFGEEERMGVDLTRVLHATILAHKRALHSSIHDIHAQAIAYYNLGWAEHRAHTCLPADLRSQHSRYHRAAVKCFKRAIELEAGNPDFWNALGVVTSEINSSVAQHSFIRSLFLNERNASTWTNLGALALLQNDVQIANESFTRAQSNDPDCASAWLGQGFVALLLGDAKEARALFTHAMDISGSGSILTRQQYSLSMFDHIMSSSSKSLLTSLVQPWFALNQLQGLDPENIAYNHLATLFQERIHDSPRAAALLGDLCNKLEVNYEATESAESLARFALAKTDCARLYLAAKNYSKAVDCGELALQLSSDEADNELTTEQRNKARLSAHLTLGLAQYFMNDVTEALAYFESALKESNDKPDAVCLLAQVLWATNSADARERARSALFEVIEKDASHTQAVLLLGVIALLDNDDESIEAVVTELQNLRVSSTTTDITHSQISEVLRAVALLSDHSNEDEVVKGDIMLHPHLPHGWSRLAELSNDEYPAEMALKVAMKAVPPKGELGAVDLAEAYACTWNAADAQTAIFLAPWAEGGWEALEQAVVG